MTQRTQRPPRQITLDLVRNALSFIPPDIGHDDRVRLAFAVFDGLGDAGADAWQEWASRRSGADLVEDRDTWKSAKKPGKIKVGTLFGVAKDHGFAFPKDDSPAAVPDPAALAAAAAERARKHQLDEAQYRERADKAARIARQMWADASEQGASPYLTRKGVQPHGVRFLADGTLLVPMHNAAGELQNLQRIAPEKPAGDEPEKRYLPGGRKSGLWHWIGIHTPAKPTPTNPLAAAGAAGDEANQAAAPGADQPAGCTDSQCPDAHDTSASLAVLLLAEGYATAASVHEATGYAVAVCFDGGNLKHVAEHLRAQFPRAALLVCGDDDIPTAARGKGNPGRKSAPAAARAASTDTGPAGAVFPQGLPEGGSDFNDLASVAGLDAVRAQVAAAVAALCDVTDAPAAGPDQATPADPPSAEASASPPAKKSAKGRKSSRADNASSASDTGDSVSFDRFRCDESGVWFTPPASDDGATSSVRRVCDRLAVLALARDQYDKGGALLLDFDTAFGNGRRWLMPLSMLAGDGAAYRAELLDMGFHAPTDGNRRRWLMDYLQSRRPTERVRLVDRVGWHGKVYVLPRETLSSASSEPGEQMMFHSDAPVEDTFGRRGTLVQWHERIGRYCVGNSRLMFAASAALAGPLLAWVPGMESGGFHLRGDSSCGKTTALQVGASVWGGRDFMQRWRATDNGLEAQAVKHSDCLLVLDELGQIDAKVAGESAYMLANGQGKIRGRAAGGSRPALSWRLLWLSAGEIPLAQHMAEAGKRIRAGQELRMVDMPADAGCGLGLFETVHDFDGGALLAQHLAKSCETTHGTLGRAWLEWLTEHSGQWHHELREQVELITLALVPETADGQIQRAGRRFALVAAAGEMATRQGLTGWRPGDATDGVRRCFLAWIGARSAGFGNSEKTEALRQVRAYLEKNGDALFTWWHRVMDDHKPNTALRVGFKRMVDEQGDPLKFDAASDYVDARTPTGERSTDAGLIEYLVMPEAFKHEVCKGLDAHFVAKVLKEAGCLKHESGRDTIRQRLPGIGKAPVFHILPSVFADEGDEL
ncbi:MAG: DUF927 domain-containing protein [Leptothrix sp. (in: b-proteobacteria)]